MQWTGDVATRLVVAIVIDSVFYVAYCLTFVPNKQYTYTPGLTMTKIVTEVEVHFVRKCDVVFCFCDSRFSAVESN